MSKDVIWTHYKELKKAGIIVGATIQYNFQKFGYSGFAMILLNVESQNLTDVFNCISKIPDVYAFRYYNSTYNIAAISTLKSLNDLERVKQVINKENKINEFKTQLWIDVRNIPENILADPESQNEDAGSQVNTQKNPRKIDEIDMQIINALTINGRLAFRKIAQQIGTTTATVARRYAKLKGNNFIKVSIQINFLEMGYQNILEISLALADQNEANEMANKLSKIPGVTYLVKISGNYDMSVVALVKDCKNIVEISDKIIQIPKHKKDGSNTKTTSSYLAWSTTVYIYLLKMLIVK